MNIGVGDKAGVGVSPRRGCSGRFKVGKKDGNGYAEGFIFQNNLLPHALPMLIMDVELECLHDRTVRSLRHDFFVPMA
jgi:hypothetical protein